MPASTAMPLEPDAERIESLRSHKNLGTLPMPDGHAIGSLCMLDRQPLEIPDPQPHALADQACMNRP